MTGKRKYGTMSSSHPNYRWYIQAIQSYYNVDKLFVFMVHTDVTNAATVTHVTQDTQAAELQLHSCKGDDNKYRYGYYATFRGCKFSSLKQLSIQMATVLKVNRRPS